MKPKVRTGKQAIKDMYESLKTISDAVGTTLGPGGRPFVFDRIDVSGRVSATYTKDGLTVMRSLGFEEPYAEAVLSFCRQAASHSVIESGDGTSSTVILAAAIAEQILKTNHKWPQAFARKLDKESKFAIEAIKKESFFGDDVVRKVALTSTNGDEELTDITLDAIQKSSAHGAIIVEKNPASKIRYRITTQDGYSHCHGYSYSNTLAWSASEKAASNEPIEWENPCVAIFNGNLLQEKQITNILKGWNKVLENDVKNLVIVAYEVGDEIINKLLVINRTFAKKGAGIFIVRPRLSAEIDSGLQCLRDIAAFCGVTDSQVIDGGNYQNADESFFGTCSKIRITPTNSVFMGRSKLHWVDQRIQQNLNIASEARSQADKEMTIKRNAQLTEGLVKVEVGAGMIPDLQERADRLDDASKAAQACLRNGALPGCGVSYIRAGELINASTPLKNALNVIHHQILENYGIEKRKIKKLKKGETVKITEEEAITGNALDLGILDATDTVCSVIKNGVELGIQIAILGGYSLRSNIGMISEE